MATRKKDKGLAVEGLRIACGLDWRGGLDEMGFEREDVPVFAFIGATEQVLRDVFVWLCRGGHVARGFRLGHEHAPAWRNGHCYRRITIELIDYRPAFLSTAELQTLIAARLQAAGHEVEFFEYEKFINL